jgi:hypothetical protein
LIEAVAKSIYEALNQWRGGWVNASTPTRQRYLAIAATAVEIMKEREHETDQE